MTDTTTEPSESTSSVAALSRFASEVKTLVEMETKRQAEDWDYLASVNSHFTARYESVERVAEAFTISAGEAKAKCMELRQYFAEIDEFLENLDTLEAAAAKLDEYSRALEKRFAP